MTVQKKTKHVPPLGVGDVVILDGIHKAEGLVVDHSENQEVIVVAFRASQAKSILEVTIPADEVTRKFCAKVQRQ